MASPLKAETDATSPAPTSRLGLAAGLDTFVVVLFVAIGRRNHDADTALGGLVETAAPFLIGLGLAWVTARAWRTPTSLTTGVAVWVATVIYGMLMRNLVFDRGTAASFVVVATLFLGLGLVGWRALLTWRDRRAKLGT